MRRKQSFATRSVAVNCCSAPFRCSNVGRVQELFRETELASLPKFLRHSASSFYGSGIMCRAIVGESWATGSACVGVACLARCRKTCGGWLPSLVFVGVVVAERKGL